MPKGNKDEVVPEDVLAQSENFLVWVSRDEEDEIYHVELDVVTLHFFSEDWAELVTLIADADFARKQK